MFKCDICDKKYDNKNSLNAHRTVHFRMKEVSREDFSIGYRREQEIKHIKKYKCDICGLSFTRSHGLGQHRSTHFKSFECNICKKILTSEKRLRNHYKKCKELNDKYNDLIINIDYVVCPICNEKRESLKNHIRIHNLNKNQFYEKFHNCKLVCEKSEKKRIETYNKKFGIPSSISVLPKPIKNKKEEIIDSITDENVIYTGNNKIFFRKTINNKLEVKIQTLLLLVGKI